LQGDFFAVQYRTLARARLLDPQESGHDRQASDFGRRVGENDVAHTLFPKNGKVRDVLVAGQHDQAAGFELSQLGEEEIVYQNRTAMEEFGWSTLRTVNPSPAVGYR
jgi:hypothetical protein